MYDNHIHNIIVNDSIYNIINHNNTNNFPSNYYLSRCKNCLVIRYSAEQVVHDKKLFKRTNQNQNSIILSGEGASFVRRPVRLYLKKQYSNCNRVDT